MVMTISGDAEWNDNTRPDISGMLRRPEISPANVAVAQIGAEARAIDLDALRIRRVGGWGSVPPEAAEIGMKDRRPTISSNRTAARRSRN